MHEHTEPIASNIVYLAGDSIIGHLERFYGAFLRRMVTELRRSLPRLNLKGKTAFRRLHGMCVVHINSQDN